MSGATTGGYVDSWYAASANETLAADGLDADIDCDVCIVGGGLTGCSAALELAQRGYDTVLLESHRAGWGCSGRSGGQLIVGYSCDIDKLRRYSGPDDAKRLWDMSLEAMELVRSNIANHAIDCHYRPGMLHVAIKKRQREELLGWQHEMRENYGYGSLDWLEGEALQSVLSSPRYIGGLLDSNGGHFHPLNYTLGIAHAARAAGARIFENSAVTNVDMTTTPVAHTASGKVRARHLVLAGNAHLGTLAGDLHRRIMPVGTYIVATEPLGSDRAASLIPADVAVSDVNFVLDYFRLSHDTRLLFGGRVSYSTLEPPNLTASLLNRMRLVFPDLADTAAEYTWGGYVAITRNRAPNFGRLGDNVYYAQGFSGHGMATTSLAGKLMAEAIAGTAERFDVFARLKHRAFPGGTALRTPLLVLAMAWFRLRDML